VFEHGLTKCLPSQRQVVKALLMTAAMDAGRTAGNSGTPFQQADERPGSHKGCTKWLGWKQDDSDGSQRRHFKSWTEATWSSHRPRLLVTIFGRTRARF
jgi:hypothetical protein